MEDRENIYLFQETNSEDSQIKTSLEETKKSAQEKLSRLSGRKRTRFIDEILRKYLNDKYESTGFLPIKIGYFGFKLNQEIICDEIYDQFGIYIEEYSRFDRGWFFDELETLRKVQLKKNKLARPSTIEKNKAVNGEKLRQKNYACKLESWLQELVESKARLKLNVTGGVDRIWVSNETGIPFSHLINKNTVCFNLITDARKKLGTENKCHRQDVQNNIKLKTASEYTYKKLLDFGIDCRKEELKTVENPIGQINNTRYGLSKFLNVTGLKLDNQIGVEFGVMFEDSVEEVKTSIKKINSKKKFSTEIKRWQSYYCELIKIDALPPDFAGALKVLVEESGKTYYEIAKFCFSSITGGSSTLKEWAQGTTVPAVESLLTIYKLEEYFDIPKKKLASKIIFFDKRGFYALLKRFEITKNCNSQTLSKIISYLPKHFVLWDRNEQQNALEKFFEYQLENTNPYRETMRDLTAKPYLFNQRNFPAELIDEIKNFNDFKTASYIPEHYIRSAKCKWKNSTGRNGSLKMFIDGIESFFGVLKLNQESGGASVKMEQLTLPLLILPKAWHLYIKFIEKRRDGIISSGLRKTLCPFINMIDLEEGWITQNPEFAEKLTIIPGLLSDDEIKKAKSDWKKFLGENRNQLEKVLRNINEIVAESSIIRDSHLPILPILQHESPWLLLMNTLDAYKKDIPDKTIAPLAHAVKIRNIVFLSILFETALRKGNMIDITWSAKNTGQLQKKADGNYRLVIPHTAFKNSQSEFFGQPGRKKNYICDLSEDITLFINLYLEECRPLLINQWKKRNENINMEFDEISLFISSGGISEYAATRHREDWEEKVSPKITATSVDKMMYKLTEEYLVYNPITGTGIIGVQPFLVHCVRHIVATHVLKKSRSYQDAADAIQDTVETVKKHYAVYLTEDRVKHSRNYLRELKNE